MHLIIVESPTKAKTISKFLDKSYRVESSFGHIRDLPTNKLGIDVNNNFEPQYVITDKAKKVVSSLKAASKKATSIILASDEDREGEAIAWHLLAALNLDEKNTQRIAFHEITKNAILEALAHPRQLDHNLVDAQQARRILDRLVGYELSPFLWKKVAKGLSAGRVQSVATKMIVEREREIKNFNVEEYWSLSADFEVDRKSFVGTLHKINGHSFDKLEIKKEQALIYQKEIEASQHQILKIEKKSTSKSPGAPFTTSTLQQSANRHLGFSAKQTMMIAQKLYEEGYITYMRTDSLNLSPKFLEDAYNWISANLGPDYLPPKSGRVFKNKSKNAQEAHEAIRPTEASTTPDSLLEKLEKNQERLYRLIWQRAIASQLPAAKLNATIIDVESKNKKESFIFRANGQILIFPGYLKIWPEKTKEQELPPLQEKQILKLISLKTEQHFTNPPARYSDASLVKEMEKHGIGRPSTYAPTINTIIVRNYVIRDEAKRLQPTEIAFVVTDLLVKHFPEIVDYQFTATMEDDLDSIATDKKKWQPVIKSFYDKFHTNLENKYMEINKTDIMPEESSDEVCDKCGAMMIIKTGRYGKFLACSAYPECKNIKKIAKPGMTTPTDNPQLKALAEKHAGQKCDKCGSPLVVKVGKYGPFLACSAYPKCKNIKNIEEEGAVKIICPACGEGQIIKKFSRRGAFYACSAYPKCKNAYWGKPTGEKCPICSALLITDKNDEVCCSQKNCGYKK